MKPKTQPHTSGGKDANEASNSLEALIAELLPKVRAKLGPEKLDRLGKTPLAIGAGGIDAILQQACKDCIGHPDPMESAVARVPQLCGVITRAPQEKAADLPATKETPTPEENA